MLYRPKTETQAVSNSPRVRESGSRNLGNIRLWNPKSLALEPGIRLEKSEIQPTGGIQNPSPTSKD